MEVEYKNIDPKLIVNEIRNGRSIEAVQKLFGLRFKSEVQDLYMKGLMELGEIPPVDFSKRKRSQQHPVPSVKESPPIKAKSQPPVAPEPVAVPPKEHIGNRQQLNQFNKSVRSEINEIKADKPNKPVVIRKREKRPSVLIKTSNFRTIGQSGSVTLNKALLIDQLKFSVGDTFEIYREDDKIILQKIDNPPI